MIEGSLHLDEAVLLGYALAMRAAENAGVRALAIKGPVLEMQGLRKRTQSVDVDILVDPAGMSDVVAELGRSGWQDPRPYDTPTVMRRHSATLRHVAWPCELDIHDYFPGFLENAQAVFETLWRRREKVQVAGRALDATDPIASLAIAGLHYLRHASALPGRQAQLDSLVALTSDTWTAARSADLLDLAVETGAVETMEPLLRRLGIPIPISQHRGSAELHLWRLGSETETTTATLQWLVPFRRSPWRERPRLVRLAVWPSEAEVRRLHPELPPGRRWVSRVRLRRLRQGLVDLPRAVREIRSTRGF